MTGVQQRFGCAMRCCEVPKDTRQVCFDKLCDAVRSDHKCGRKRQISNRKRTEARFRSGEARKRGEARGKRNGDTLPAA